jgi:predicted RNA-binding protein with PUA-like domain
MRALKVLILGILRNYAEFWVQFATIIMNYWLVKQEPEAYSWADLIRDKKTAWTGVRNFQARNNLRSMQKNDPVLFYHSVSDKQIVGLAKVVKTAYPDPTATEGDWVCVDIGPDKSFKKPVDLATIKITPGLENIALIKQSRLSVMPLTPIEFEILCKLGGL